MQDSQISRFENAPTPRPRKGRRPASAFRPRLSSLRGAFTLTELLIVIAIIAVLAGLIAAAAVNALRTAKRNRILLEIKNVSTSLENFKNDFGAYPPNGMNPNPTNNPPPGSPAALVQGDFQRMLKKAYPRHREPQALILALCGQNLSGGANENLVNGMTAAEALYFWLGGFSSDEQFPISGAGGPSFATNGSNPGEVLEDRNRRYEFDLGRLGPRNDSGEFDETGQRFVVYEVDLNGDGDRTDSGERRRINFWHYAPNGSEQPLVYFDASRHKPGQYDPYASPSTKIFPLKKLREGKSAASSMRDIVYIDGKYQILHCGLDDDWGGFGESASSAGNPNELLLYPDGPFIGPVADTLTNFADGELADESEE